MPRKVVYETDRNFGVKTLEPLFAFFNDLDAGLRTLPPELAEQSPTAAAKEAGGVMV